MPTASRSRFQFHSLVTALALLGACSTDENKTPDKAPADVTPAVTPAPAPAANPVEAMDAAIKALMAKPEQKDEAITVQHVLIAFQGAPRITGVTRNKDEAKVLAAEVLQQALGGADFKALMQKHSNDSGGGEYPMTKAGRMQMVKAFGDVGFRLDVGEIGVAPWDATASPFGWHIIKRVK